MDADIRQNLKELGKHVNDIGRQIASTKSNQEGLKAMSESLDTARKTLDIYIGIQARRHSI